MPNLHRIFGGCLCIFGHKRAFLVILCLFFYFMLGFDVDLTNVSLGSDTSRVLVRFGSLSGQLCLGWVRVKFGFRSFSGKDDNGSGSDRVNHHSHPSLYLIRIIQSTYYL